MTIVKDAGLARASMPLELKAGGSEGTFEGYGAIFGNVDRDGDTVARGAFAESLKARLPMLLWQHDTKAPIGRFDEVREDERGLYVRGRLSMSGRGAEAYELLRMGALDGLSIGFVTREATRDSATGTRTILKADLMEVSLVTFPANELARITSVKSAHGSIPDDPRAFEHFLRDNGFSRTRARTITAKGFGGEPSAQEIAALVAEVKRRQLRLDQKLAPLLAGLITAILSGGTTALVQYGLEEHRDQALLKNAALWLKDYEADSRQGRAVHHLQLKPGQHSGDLKFPAKHNGGNRKLLILTDNDARSEELIISCSLRYVDWTGTVPTLMQKKQNKVSVRDGRFAIEGLMQGHERDMAEWLQNVTVSSFSQARGGVGRYQSPTLFFEYHGARSGRDAPVRFEFSLA